MKISIKRILNSELIFLALILLINLVLNIININKFFPITEGWFQEFAALILDGEIIYRDFYMFVPPGFVFLMTALQGTFGTYYLMFRIYGVIERLLLITVVYFILRRFFKGKTIFIALSAAAIIYVSNYQDIYYGYYQSCLLFSVLSLFFMLKLSDNYDNSKKRIIYSVLLGVFCGISILFKQTTGILVPAALLVLSLFTFLKKGRKKYFFTLLYVIGGFLLAVLPMFLYLAVNGALIPFFNQVLNGSSKGSVFGVVFGFITREMFEQVSYNTLAIMFFSALFVAFSFIKNKNIKDYLIIFTRIAAFLTIAVFLYVSVAPWNTFSVASLFTVLAIIFAVIIGFVFFKWKLYEKKYVDCITAGAITLGLLCCFIFTMFNSEFLVNYKSFNYICFPIFTLMIILGVYHFVLVIKNNNKSSVQFLLVVGVAIIIMYAHGMSFVLEPHCLLLPFSLLICLLLENKLFAPENKWFFLDIPKLSTATEAEMPNEQTFNPEELLNRKTKVISVGNKIKNIVLYFLCMFLIISIGGQKAQRTYVWWGVEQPPIYAAKYDADDDTLKGIKLSEETAEMLNSIKKLVDLNKREGDTMYTFSHLNYFKVMEGMKSNTFAKVHYFDVCPDEIAIEDAQRLIDYKNSFIIWQDFTESEWEFHERYFRGGNPSGQRAIRAAVNTMFSDGSYIFLGEFRDKGTNPIQVWVIDDGRPVYNLQGERIK